MKKPRALERRLLDLYMNVYEEWVHDPFFSLRNRQIVHEEGANASRAELSRHVSSILDKLTSCIDKYAAFIWVTLEVKREFFAPMIGHLCDAPEIWRQTWDNRERTEKELQMPAKEDLSVSTSLYRDGLVDFSATS
jgi:hypothetical protein